MGERCYVVAGCKMTELLEEKVKYNLSFRKSWIEYGVKMQLVYYYSN